MAQMSEGMDLDKLELGVFGMVVDMLLNSAEDKYRESLRDVDGKKIQLEFVDSGSMALVVNGDKVESFTGVIDDPETLVIIKKTPDELLSMIGPILGPILLPITPHAIPMLFDGITLREAGRMILDIIPAIPSMAPPVLSLVNLLLTRKIAIKGSIAVLLPILEVFLIPFLTGEEDPKFAAQRAREEKEFAAGPPPGWY